jgi:hypothetical protein
MEKVFILAADIAFKVPVLRELFLCINARAANEAVIEDVFRGGGSVAVFPGGIHEQLRTDPNQEKLSFPPNLGFVRQAIKHGVPLVPLYNFGENQQFGRWGLPFMPRFHPFQSRFGRMVEVGPADHNPSDARVRRVFIMYCAELRRLFDEFKDTALPSVVADRGLKIEWRGHETDDLSLIDLECHVANQLDRGAKEWLAASSTVDTVSHLVDGCERGCEGEELLHAVQTDAAKQSANVQLRSRI